jgi:MinD superfamily P-loop ATPase
MCQYHAIVCLETEPLVFSELCHGCGGCAKVCPTGAITEVPCEIGTVRTGAHNGIDFIQGQLKVGQPMSPPVIRAVKKHAADDSLNIIDCPPGTACPVVTAVKDSDLVILVTEPTPFGLHDLKLAVDMVRELKIPFGVVVNRVGAGDDRVHAFCREQEIPILLEIPDDRRIAETYSRGELMVEALPKYRPLFAGLLSQLLEVKISGGG